MIFKAKIASLGIGSTSTRIARLARNEMRK